MKQILLFLFLLGGISLQAQEDTTIYRIVDIAPRFPGCELYDTTIAAKTQCSQASLMAFIYGNIVYPWEARENGNEGMVVATFVIEKDGYISNPVILKDIGGGCGEEALRVLNGMNGALKSENLSWLPGLKNDSIVRTQFTLPIKFRLQDPPDFVMIGRDTNYVVVDDSLTFKGGREALAEHLAANLNYPDDYRDSCFIGDMDVKVIIQPDGVVNVVDVVDYNNLGTDFQFEAIQMSTSTFGLWEPATRKGRKVPSSYDFTLTFVPENPSCQSRIDDYSRANALAIEARELANKDELEPALAKYNEAVDLFPNNANFRYLRGETLMAMDRMDEACEDFYKVKEIIPFGVANQLIGLMCK